MSLFSLVASEVVLKSPGLIATKGMVILLATAEEVEVGLPSTCGRNCD